MSLTRFSLLENPYENLANKIRHIYDIHMMLGNSEIKTFFESDRFDKMMITVGNDDVVSYKNNNEWLKTHPAEAIIFSQSEKTWAILNLLIKQHLASWLLENCVGRKS